MLDERTVAYPEYRGNGVMASLGNLSENPHLGILFVDFTGDKIGLHVNGRARIIENEELLNEIKETLAFYSDPAHFMEHCNLGKVEFDFNGTGTWFFGHHAKALLEKLK